jgi:hypothetical protein
MAIVIFNDAARLITGNGNNETATEKITEQE